MPAANIPKLMFPSRANKKMESRRMMNPELFVVLGALSAVAAYSVCVTMCEIFRNDSEAQDEPVRPSFSDADDDPVLQEIMRRCFESGNIVIGRVYDDGKVTIEEFSSSGEKEQKQ